MQTQSLDIPLHDIKPLVEVPDNSFILFVILVVVATVLLLGLAYLLFHYIKRRKRENRRKDALSALKSVDFKDAKHAAYAITKHGLVFANDAPRMKEAYDNLVNRLSIYKYKKIVDDIDDECRSYYKIYLGMIDA